LAAEKDRAVAPQQISEVEPVDFTGKRLLLVEDNELNREIEATVLTGAGFVVDEAEDGSVAVEKVRNAAAGLYDVVLMDIQMPVMDGYAATKEIRSLENKKLAAIPIIAVSANAYDEDVKASLAAGMNGHIAKPIDVKKLMMALSRVLKSKK
jgi:CheY-like chemotaxis protein